MDSLSLNGQLRGFTVVLSLSLGGKDECSTYDLVLHLAESSAVGSRAIAVVFVEVTSLSVSDFGGGLTQLLHLHVIDVGHHQRDRVSLEVTELERGSLSLSCRRAEILRRYHVGDDPKTSAT
jgi:hypothetical protein